MILFELDKKNRFKILKIHLNFFRSNINIHNAIIYLPNFLLKILNGKK